ncbi:MAG: Peptidoglycan-associated lipoprotein [Syntrophus sp. SKADARSKE-3]|nr:Peptidoglycan-associated lipoprotein [Syntrophus sp. SKADARSKE-3]
MRRSYCGWMIVILCCVFFTGCASTMKFSAVDLNDQIKSGQLMKKVDNAVILVDRSASMEERYGNARRLELGSDVTNHFVETMPDIDLKVGVRSFAGDETPLIYGMSAFNKADLLQNIQSNSQGAGRTPLGEAIRAAGDDLKPYSGPLALIIVSDFETLLNLDDIRPKYALESVAQVKALYGDRLCIYTIQVAQAPGGTALVQAIQKEAKCGLAVNADDLATQKAMSEFVKKIFLADADQTMGAQKKAAAGTAESDAKNAESVQDNSLTLEDIHFAFDKAALTEDGQRILKKHAAWLKENKKGTLTVEGHCDERGTTEYNLALGEKRATEAKKFLVTLGVENTRIKTISYGKERPLDPGHTETAWAKNRRDRFVVSPVK